MKTKVIYITHRSDNDGVFSVIMGKEYVLRVLKPYRHDPVEDTTIIPVYNAGDAAMLKTLETKLETIERSDNLIIMVTDIGFYDDTHKKISELTKSTTGGKVTLIYVDHHESVNLDLVTNLYDIVNVDIRTCATMNVYKMIEEHLVKEATTEELEKFTQKFFMLCTYVNDRDLFIKKYTESDDMFLLYTALGWDRMYEAFENFDGKIIPDGYQILLDYIKRDRNKMIMRYYDQIENGNIVSICGFNVAHVIDQGYFSDGAEACLNKFQHLDAIFSVNPSIKQVSLRCRKTDTRFQFGKMALRINKGGGHFAAAGYPCEEVNLDSAVSHVVKQLTHEFMGIETK